MLPTLSMTDTLFQQPASPVADQAADTGLMIRVRRLGNTRFAGYCFAAGNSTLGAWREASEAWK
jgi:hypothetical protein